MQGPAPVQGPVLELGLRLGSRIGLRLGVEAGSGLEVGLKVGLEVGLEVGVKGWRHLLVPLAVTLAPSPRTSMFEKICAEACSSMMRGLTWFRLG